MKKTRYIFLVTAILLSATVSAHGGLENRPKTEIIETQKMLVKENYLKADAEFEYGIVNTVTDEAYDKYQEDQLRARIKAEQEEFANNTENKLNEPVVPRTFWSKIVEFFKGLF